MTLVGVRVRALYPNSQWGEGVVISDDPDRTWRNPATNRLGRAKPLIVRRADGTVGNFHYEQVERINGDPLHPA